MIKVVKMVFVSDTHIYYSNSNIFMHREKIENDRNERKDISCITERRILMSIKSFFH